MDSLTFIVAVITSLFGALLLLGPCGFDVDEPSLSEEEKKANIRINRVLHAIYTLAILYLLLCTECGHNLLDFLMGPITK